MLLLFTILKQEIKEQGYLFNYQWYRVAVSGKHIQDTMKEDV